MSETPTGITLITGIALAAPSSSQHATHSGGASSSSAIEFHSLKSPKSHIEIDVLPPDPSLRDLEAAVSSDGKGGDDVDHVDENTLLLEPPPSFGPYVPEYFRSANGDIVSHDHHLNEDGEALYRFVLDHASERPSLLLKCKGSHTEWRTRQVTRYEDGKNVSSTETSSETIVDFDFIIDASSAILPETLGAPIWIVGDKDAAYRGRRSLEVDSTPKLVVDGDHAHEVDMEPGLGPFGRPRTWRRKATTTEQNASDSWAERRSGFGYAPWVFIRGQIRGLEASIQSEEARVRMLNASRTATEHGELFDDSDIRLSTRNLRDWADEYCESRRILKEFEFKKIIYGWNMSALRQAVESTIRGNYVHYDKPVIDFMLEGDAIVVRADNKLSRMLSKTWILVLLWITLIYPLVIWPFSRFNSRGAGKWKVAGSAFGLTKWVHQSDSRPGETPDDYLQRKSGSLKGTSALPLLKATPLGISRLEGVREGEWFSQWEDTIASLVRQRYISDYPLSTPLHSPKTAGTGLDGYTPQA